MEEAHIKEHTQNKITLVCNPIFVAATHYEDALTPRDIPIASFQEFEHSPDPVISWALHRVAETSASDALRQISSELIYRRPPYYVRTAPSPKAKGIFDMVVADALEPINIGKNTLLLFSHASRIISKHPDIGSRKAYVLGLLENQKETDRLLGSSSIQAIIAFATALGLQRRDFITIDMHDPRHSRFRIEDDTGVDVTAIHSYLKQSLGRTKLDTRTLVELGELWKSIEMPLISATSRSRVNSFTSIIVTKAFTDIIVTHYKENRIVPREARKLAGKNPLTGPIYGNISIVFESTATLALLRALKSTSIDRDTLITVIKNNYPTTQFSLAKPRMSIKPTV